MISTIFLSLAKLSKPRFPKLLFTRMLGKVDLETPLRGHLFIKSPYSKLGNASVGSENPEMIRYTWVTQNLEMGKLQFHLGCIKFMCCNFMWDRLHLFVCLFVFTSV